MKWETWLHLLAAIVLLAIIFYCGVRTDVNVFSGAVNSGLLPGSEYNADVVGFR